MVAKNIAFLFWQPPTKHEPRTVKLSFNRGKGFRMPKWVSNRRIQNVRPYSPHMPCALWGSVPWSSTLATQAKESVDQCTCGQYPQPIGIRLYRHGCKGLYTSYHTSLTITFMKKDSGTTQTPMLWIFAPAFLSSCFPFPFFWGGKGGEGGGEGEGGGGGLALLSIPSWPLMLATASSSGGASPKFSRLSDPSWTARKTRAPKMVQPQQVPKQKTKTQNKNTCR